MGLRKVVVTGLGAVTPAGVTAQSMWKGLVSCTSYIRQLEPEDLRWGGK